MSTADSGGWSISEDCLLRSLKESKDNLPWSEIGTALSRSRSDAKSRWSVIRDQPSQLASSDETDDDEQQSLGLSEASASAKAPGEAASTVGQESQSVAEARGDAKAKAKAEAAAATKWHSGHRDDKVGMENKSVRSKAKERERDILSGEEASSESSDGDTGEDDAGGLHYGWPEPKRHDVHYLRSHIYPELYPSLIQP